MLLAQKFYMALISYFWWKSYWQEAEVGIVFAVEGLFRGRWLFWSQYAPSGEWCFKANTQYMHTIAVITIAVINETLKAALQGHLLPSRLIKGLSLTSIKTEKKRGRGWYRERERACHSSSHMQYIYWIILQCLFSCIKFSVTKNMMLVDC